MGEPGERAILIPAEYRKPWAHQEFAVSEVLRLMAEGVRRIVVTSPTGSGKALVMEVIVRHFLNLGWRGVLYTNRTLLREQIARDMDAAGIDYGIRAAGHEANLAAAFQLSSIQTERARVYGTGVWDLHDADFAIVDESHINREETAVRIQKDHLDGKCKLWLGLTATPLGIGHMYDEMIVAAVNSTLRKSGILVPARHFAVDEPDCRNLKRTVTGEYSEGDLTKLILSPTVAGRVMAAWRKNNPIQKPTILFGPSVSGSLWFAEQFHKAGISAAHIDGEHCWINGILYESGPEVRDDVMSSLKSGDIKVLCNRFVCLDSETEILTMRGWAGIGDMTEDDLVANWQEGKTWFEKHNGIIVRDRDPNERMVFLETSRRSIRVTEDHEILYRTTRSGRFLKDRAKNLANRAVQVPISGQGEPLDFDVDPKKKVSSAERSRKISANAFQIRFRDADMDYQESIALATERQLEREGLRHKSPHELSEAECEFIGFWLGDGNTQKLSSGGVEYRLWQGTECSVIVDRINWLIKEMGVDFVKHKLKHANCLQWSLSRGTGGGPQRRRGIYHIEPYLKKDGTDLYWALDEKQFDALIRGFWMADGQHGNHVKPSHREFNRIFICGTNKKIFDLLQAIAVCRGYRASIRGYKSGDRNTLFNFSLTKLQSHAMTRYRLQFEDGWKPEKVWCVRSTSGNIITRRKGSVTVMGNCREGIDVREVECLIFATMFGALQSYIQAGGRGLRACPRTGKKECIINDHGSHWWRLGSLNTDWQWKLGQNNLDMTKEIEEKHKKPPEERPVEPISCVQCGLVRSLGPKCPACGFQQTKRSRLVVQTDGTLRERYGDAWVQREAKVEPDTVKLWKSMVFRGRAGNMSFRQCFGLFYKDHGYTPPRDLPMMPKEESDWGMKVKDVPFNRLRPTPPKLRTEPKLYDMMGDGEAKHI